MKKKSMARQGSASETEKAKNAAGSAGEGPPRLDQFLHLSRILTAHALDHHLAEAYLKRMDEVPGSKLDALLNRYQALLRAGRDPADAVRNDILPDPALGPVAKTVLLLWYIGGLQTSDGGDWEMQSADQYYRALVWEAIGAHPPTLSNGYFGHWKYPPEM